MIFLSTAIPYFLEHYFDFIWSYYGTFV